MTDDSASIVPTTRKQTLGDHIRGIAAQLRQEDEIQIKATSRILGAAAQLAQNHDRLIDEVVEMVEEDLEQTAQPQPPEPYSVEQLKQQFESLKEAKAHFNLKARSWDALVEKLNEHHPSPFTDNQPAGPSHSPTSRAAAKQSSQDTVSQRLERIEQDIQLMRGDLSGVIQLLELLVAKLT